MKLITNTKILRKMLILCLLTTGLLFVASNNAKSVSAKDCLEAATDFFSALNGFDVAFNSYYRNDPTTCNYECRNFVQGTQEYTDCFNSCRQTRRTNVNNSQLSILQASADLNSCTNPEPDYCGNARAMANDCLARYNYSQYSDPEQRLDVFTVYYECRDASGIDNCQ